MEEGKKGMEEETREMGDKGDGGMEDGGREEETKEK
jgi:hypothetical protein